MLNISLKAEEVFRLLGFPVTNSLLAEVVALLGLFLLFWRVRRRLTLKPGKLQLLFEATIDYFVDLVNQILNDRSLAKKVFPLVATIFIFVLSANWLGLFPGVGAVGFFESTRQGETFAPLLRSPNSDLNMTLALTIISMTAIHVIGFSIIGGSRYLAKFFNLRNPLKFYVGLLELISEIGRFIAFAFRLFGNILAGEILLLVIAFLVPLVAPLPFLGLEVLVGIVQAFVFAVLTLVFIKVATVEMEH